MPRTFSDDTVKTLYPLSADGLRLRVLSNARNPKFAQTAMAVAFVSAVLGFAV